MNYFLAVFVAGLLTACAASEADDFDQIFDTVPEDKMQECLAEADAIVMGLKPSELVTEVASKLLERRDTYKGIEDVSSDMNELLDGSISSDKGSQLVNDCDKLSGVVGSAMFKSSCGPYFGMDIGVHGKKRDHYLKGHDHLKKLVEYKEVCDLLEDLQEIAASKV